MNIIQSRSDNSHLRIVKPQAIILHYISARYTTPKDPYNIQEILRILRQYNCSYHDIISRDGDCHQLVDPTYTAYHAGVANLFGLRKVNDRSIGLAYVAKHEDQPTNTQYYGLASRIKYHLKENPTIKPNWILGHDMVSGDWVRGKGQGKVDPGHNMNYSFLYQLIFQKDDNGFRGFSRR